eukprot:8200095-Alexandrium_andersonii.AAC.1
MAAMSSAGAGPSSTTGGRNPEWLRRRSMPSGAPPRNNSESSLPGSLATRAKASNRVALQRAPGPASGGPRARDLQSDSAE